MVSTSGSIETVSKPDSEEEIFTLLSIAVFRQIAREASRQKHSKSGNNCDVNHLRKLDSGELINVEHVTFVDFENLDVQDVDWSAIYAS